ncbi:exodeoxyribonuclease VII small subunit [Nostoc sp. PCC 7107]|uniref:exodeoxyribonuclease VII small subunit n=1 Tax=Nostoc sp. PCC 7107 TaxID=317936 RepID=UPI00029F3091|nr:exodeoxyribonuclease VII small subunit [Nostoc sp. PCC 7107]AFY45140.1 Exodeoxyribonuclease VII small subunit [Nostoc sp. PCC 7107]
MVKRKSSSDFEAIASVNYEAKVVEIEKIIARIEAGELGLEEVFEQFATAVEHIRQCEGFLQQRQQQVDLLIETLNDG